MLSTSQTQSILYSALNWPPERTQANHFDVSELYGEVSSREGEIFIKTGFLGDVLDKNNNRVSTDEFHIAYTLFKNKDARFSFVEGKDTDYVTLSGKGPIVLFLHGVPTNKRQWYPVAKMVARFSRVICIDMLGMGESSKPMNYGKSSTLEHTLNATRGTI